MQALENDDWKKRSKGKEGGKIQKNPLKKQKIKTLWDFDEEVEKYGSAVYRHTLLFFLSIVSVSGSCSPQVQNLATVNKEEINHCSPIS